jgi:hypothetical protein
MVQFECSVLEGTATVKIITPQSITEPGPDADPCRAACPLAYVNIGHSTIDCENKADCGITEWEQCPAYIAMRDQDTLQYLPGSRALR